MRQIKKTNYFSWAIGKLPKGCQLCVQGKKEVLFVTGVCSEKCYFCPISDMKKDKDVVYADEWPISKDEEVIEEARLCESEGAGITGGDPLARLDKTLHYIKLLKQTFGKNFHIHLYTPLTLVNEDTIKKLEEAGLDEIRFHTNLDDDKLWQRIEVKTSMIKGIEIPVIPGKKENIIKMIDFIKDKVNFLNMNELELSDSNASKLAELGYEPKNELSYGVKDSEDLAKELLRYCCKTDLNVHYCTTKLKDSVQLMNRLKRRSKNVIRPYDTLTRENNLKRGAVYLKGLTAGFSYNAKIAELKASGKAESVIKQLKHAKGWMMSELKIPENMVEIDDRKLRILTSIDNARRFARDLKKKGLEVAVVEELPTYDQFELENEDL